MLIDRHIGDCRALVIDSNPTSRSILSAQLREFGVGQVIQAGRVQDARRQLEVRTFDIVLCEQHFNGDQSGQDLLDDLRRANLLPLQTVFIMVTGEAQYEKVAEAAESALDGYLLKPHTATALADRVREARHRKRVLKDILQAIEEERFDDAARMCLQRFRDRAPYWLYAARIGAELLLRLERHDAAQKLFEAVIESRAVPWAKLGVARAELGANKTTQARRTLESLIVEEPSYADAYDVMGRVQVEQGQLSEALATYRQATELTPGSITRLQKQGMLAFFVGEHEESARALERAVSSGISSKMFDYQSLVLLAFARFQQRDTKGLQRCLANIAHALEKAPKSARLRRFEQVARVLSLMLGKQIAMVVSEVRSLAAQIHDPDFDIEAACNLLALVAQLTAAELQLPDAELWIDKLALRFSTSKSMAELLARSASAHEPFAQRTRAGHARVSELAEQALSHALAGDPRAAVQALVEQAGRTRNAKLVETARLTLQRHRDAIADAGEFAAQIDTLRERCGKPASAPPLGQDSGRPSGGVSLRVSQATTESEDDEARTDSPAATPAAAA